MQKFETLTGVAAPLEIMNVDTDMIIPKQYLKTIERTGLGKGLFSEMRYKDDGSDNPDFVLNKPAYRKAQIIVADIPRRRSFATSADRAARRRPIATAALWSAPRCGRIAGSGQSHGSTSTAAGPRGRCRTAGR